jgi:hypothetical protein
LLIGITSASKLPVQEISTSHFIITYDAGAPDWYSLENTFMGTIVLVAPYVCDVNVTVDPFVIEIRELPLL